MNQVLIVVSFTFWAILVGATLPAAYRLWRHKAQLHDATKWALFLVALLFVAYSARAGFGVQDKLSGSILRGLGCGLALYLLGVVRFYRNGP